MADLKSYNNKQLLRLLVGEAAKVGTARSGLVIDPAGADNTWLHKLMDEALARMGAVTTPGMCEAGGCDQPVDKNAAALGLNYCGRHLG